MGFHPRKQAQLKDLILREVPSSSERRRRTATPIPWVGSVTRIHGTPPKREWIESFILTLQVILKIIVTRK
jgi:hypothetical protein